MDRFGYGDTLLPLGLVFPFEDNSMDEYVDSLGHEEKAAVLNRMDEFHTRAEVEEFVNSFRA